jgi:glycosyltransferase involved in cell wall biosynthesis
MKIKYIGNFNDGTGWAKCSTYNAIALDYHGYDVYCEEKKYNDRHLPIEDKIEELLNKKSDNFDIVIQHILPSEYVYYGGMKNIGFIELETLNISSSIWIKNLKLMDELLVPNKASKECLIRSGIEPSKIKIMHHMFNFNKIVNYPKTADISELNGKFNFVFVGEFNKRKNLEAVLRAFHTEFEETEPVNLYIKTTHDLHTITNFCDEVKNRLKTRAKFIKEVIITNRLDEPVLFSTLRQCHAFISASHGEAWCYPAIESMAVGIPPIYTEGTGIEEYAAENASFPVKSTVSPCYGATDGLQDLYTSDENWLEIDIIDLKRNMRSIYDIYITNQQEYSAISASCIDAASKFDFTNGELIRGII